MISIQTTANGVIANMMTREITFGGKDTVYTHLDTILPSIIQKLNDTILPEYNWNLRNITNDYLTTSNSDYYFRYYNIDTACNSLFRIKAGRIMPGALGIIKDSTDCIHAPGPALVYPADIRWTYLENFGYNYYYYLQVSGDPIYTYDETTYPYIKLGNCIIGSKNVLSINEQNFSEENIKIIPVPASNYLNITFPHHQQYNFELYNTAGTKVLSLTLQTNDAVIDISFLPAGAYIARVIGTRKTSVQKILIVR